MIGSLHPFIHQVRMGIKRDKKRILTAVVFGKLSEEMIGDGVVAAQKSNAAIFCGAVSFGGQMFNITTLIFRKHGYHFFKEVISTAIKFMVE